MDMDIEIKFSMGDPYYSIDVYLLNKSWRALPGRVGLDQLSAKKAFPEEIVPTLLRRYIDVNKKHMEELKDLYKALINRRNI